MKHTAVQMIITGWMLVFVCSPNTQGAEPFRVGFAQIDITPPVGWRMYGSLYQQFATGANDPLLVRAIVFEQGGEKAAIVVCDIASVPRELTEPVRHRAAQRTGIPPANIVILATHTHGGPEYFGVQRDLRHAKAIAKLGKDPHEPIDYSGLLGDRIVQAIAAAKDKLADCRIECIDARQENMAFNRRFHMKDGSVVFNPCKMNPGIVRPAGPTDPDLPMLLFRNAEDKPIGSLTVFAMHVATFSKDNLWGADYPGVLAGRLRETFGDGFISVFGQGTSGNINHIDVTSDNPQPGDTEPIRIGNALADTLQAAQNSTSKLTATCLAVRSAIVQTPLVEITPEQIQRSRDILERTDEPGGIDFLVTVEAWKVLNTEALRKRFGETLPMEINVFRIDPNSAIVCLPHEVFVEIGLAIKAASPFRHTFVLSMAHDLDFYVLDRKGYAEGGYEAITSSVKPGAGERMIEAAGKLLRDLKP